MVKISVFPKSVQEVLSFVQNGALLDGPYSGPVTQANRFFSIKEAFVHYLNQDVLPPEYFLTDITDDASGDIPGGWDNPLKTALIEYEEKTDFYNVICDRLMPRKKELGLKKDDLETLADSIGSNLYLCAKARLLLPKSHDYFERLFQIYRDQAFPCGWRGGPKWETGDFLFFSR
jgi:hypothetical protein